MADSKVTELTAATTVNSADVLYLVQSNADKKLSISTLLANLPNTLLNIGGLLALDVDSPQILPNAGAITVNQTLTVLTSEAGTYVLTIADGTYNGQIKIVACSQAAGAQVITSNVKPSSIRFTEVGHTATLMWYSNDWWFIGGSATLVY